MRLPEESSTTWALEIELEVVIMLLGADHGLAVAAEAGRPIPTEAQMRMVAKRNFVIGFLQRLLLMF